MPAGPRHVFAAATIVIAAALVAPAVALAGSGDKCKASACLVYNEPNAPSAGGSHSQQHPTGPSTKGGGSKHVVPKGVSRVLAHLGKDRAPLSRILRDSDIGNLQAGPSSVVTPSALGAAFDIGSGPTALLAILVATAIGLGAYNGARTWRRRRA